MTYQNPITKCKYNDIQKFIDGLADSWRDLQVQKQPIAEGEQKLIDVFQELAGEPEVTTGTLTITGFELLIKIRRALNANYIKESGKPHPIEELMEKHPFLEQAFRKEFKESGQKVAKLLKTFEANPGAFKKMQAKALEKIMELRIVKPARPQISIVERTK